MSVLRTGYGVRYLGHPPVGHGVWCGPADTGSTAMPPLRLRTGARPSTASRPHGPVGVLQLDPFAKEGAQECFVVAVHI